MTRIMLMLVAMLSFMMTTEPSLAETKLTRAQVDAVCSEPKPNGSGHTGCVKDCGNKVCLYDCKGTGKNEDCRGYVALTGGGSGSQDEPEAYLPPTPGVVLVMDFVSFASLQSACSKVEDSIFARTGDAYACANPKCDRAGGTCMVVCVDRQCHALMPGKPDGKLTLLAMLQGGDDVSHAYGPTEGATTHDGSGTPGGPSAPPPPPSVVIY